MGYVRLHPEDVEAIALRLAELLVGVPRAPEPSPSLTAAEVALRFGVKREWVYEHKAELGAITLGGGKRPRLRFDPERVAAALAAGDEATPEVEVRSVMPTRRRRAADAPADLLPIRGERA